MDKWKNILDEDILKRNVLFAALFVMNFECLKDYVITQVRGFFEAPFIEDGELEYKILEKYKVEVLGLDKNIENASLKWFINSGAISEEDYKLYQKIRNRRNEITHKLLLNLSNGFSNSDITLFSNLITLYQKIDKWWINEIEIPISYNDLPENYDSKAVLGGQALVISIINDIVLGEGGNKYKEFLDEMLKTK